MSNASDAEQKSRLQSLELNLETLLDLSEQQSEDVRGGWAGEPGTAPRVTVDPIECIYTTGG